jgi:RNA polymerase sigma-70 factor (ECF subfamily)
MLPDETKADSFTEFVVGTETRLRHALTAAFGPERGREGAAEALAYGWEHWDRIGKMENPAGYLYRVGRDHARRMTPRRVPVSQTVAHPEPVGRAGASRGAGSTIGKAASRCGAAVWVPVVDERSCRLA